MKTVVHSSNGVVSKVTFEPETKEEKEAAEKAAKEAKEAAKEAAKAKDAAG